MRPYERWRSACLPKATGGKQNGPRASGSGRGACDDMESGRLSWMSSSVSLCHRLNGLVDSGGGRGHQLIELSHVQLRLVLVQKTGGRAAIVGPIQGWDRGAADIHRERTAIGEFASIC